MLNRRSSVSYWLPLLILIAAILRADPIAVVNGRPWMLRDSIGVRYYSKDPGVPAATFGFGDASTAAVWSLDRTHFFYIRHWGDFEHDSNIYELIVHPVAPVLLALKEGAGNAIAPQCIARFETRSSEEGALRDVVWSEDGTAILFQTIDGDRPRQIFRLDVKTGERVSLTSGSGKIYDFSYRDGGLVYREPPASLPPARLNYPLVAAPSGADGLPLFDSRLLGEVTGFPREPWRPLETYVKFGDADARQLKGRYSKAWISPGGRRAAMLKIEEDVSKVIFADLLDACVSQTIGFTTGTTSLLAGSETIKLPKPTVFWSQTGRWAILVNVSLPETKEHASAERIGDIIAYDVQTSNAQVIENLVQRAEHEKARYMVDANFDASAGRLSVIWRDANSQPTASHYQLVNDRWKLERGNPSLLPTQAGSRTKVGGYLKVFLREDANLPPEIVATDGSRELVLTTGDPALAGIRRAPVETIQWFNAHGETETGGLMLPPDRQPGQRLPLVVQVLEYLPGSFMPDGASTSGFAAQAFVARGYAVLQLSYVQKPQDLEKEGALFTERLDSAVEMLSLKGVVDPTWVGAVGFSRGGYELFQLITHPGRTSLAAAACLDCHTSGYMEYMSQAASYADPLSWRAIERENGGPFWAAKQSWLQHAPAFNVDRIRAPVLFTLHGSDVNVSAFYSIETIAAFRVNRKPLEYLYEPSGAHGLLRPKERLAEMQAVADWMDFWIMGKSPGNSDRAARWAVLRKQQDEVLKTPPPPKGKWVFVKEEDHEIQNEAKAPPASVMGKK